MKQNQYFEAAYYYSESVTQSDAAANVLSSLAFSLTRIGELEKAKNYYLLALKIYPKNETLKKELAELNTFLTRLPDTEEQMRQLLANRPNDPALLLKQGDILEQQGLPVKAIDVYQTANSFVLKDDEMLRRALLSRLARLLTVTHRYGEAIATYKSLLELMPDNALLYYNAASVFAVTGDIVEAEEFLRKAELKGMNVMEKIKTDPNFFNLNK